LQEVILAICLKHPATALGRREKMGQDTLRISLEEMDRRFGDLFAIKDGGSAEIFASVAKKWEAHNSTGKPLTAGYVQICHRSVKRRIERGDDLHDLHELAKNHGWSDIIYRIRPGTE
jgi:hypothetical protein